LRSGICSHRSSGHAWPGRYSSCPLDGEHLWEALRYGELNPVRAGLAIEAEAWMWSSAAAHCGIETGNEVLDLELWRNHWTASAWWQYLAAGEVEFWWRFVSARTRAGHWVAQSLYRL
jgi:hypothetical protein